jgi:hypothetical protein
MPEERNNPSTRRSRWSETNVSASSSGLKVVRLRLIAQEVKQYLQGYWSRFNRQILNVQRSPMPCRVVYHVLRGRTLKQLWQLVCSDHYLESH